MDANYRYALVALFDRVQHDLLSRFGSGADTYDYIGRVYAGIVLPVYTSNLGDPITAEIVSEVQRANRGVHDSYNLAMNIASICSRRLRELPGKES